MNPGAHFEGPVARTLNNLAVAINGVDFATMRRMPLLSSIQRSLVEKCRPIEHLIIYGSLAPGEVNHNQIAHIRGRYARGYIQGTLVKAGWGEHIGFPGLKWGPGEQDSVVPVVVLHAHDMSLHWKALDAFEGDGYQRIIVPYILQSGIWGLGCVYRINPHHQ